MDQHDMLAITDANLTYDGQTLLDDVGTAEWLYDDYISPNLPEDTLDVPSNLMGLHQLPARDIIECNIPVSPRGPPSRTNDPGDLEFIVEINANKINKKFLYSMKLNRIYVTMESNFSVHFNWNHLKAPQEMYVRATTVFWDESQAEKRVERCLQHGTITDTSEVRIRHVLHSARELGTQGVYYCGEPTLADSWYSVLVSLNKTTPEPCTHAYKFGCKNSCNSGINRRSIGIVFTLEDFNGVIKGRQSVGVRVCACPRRDLFKDESQELKEMPDRKRAIHSRPADLPLKKIKLEVVHDDEQHVYLPPLRVVGKRAAMTGLEVILRMMEQTAELKNKQPDEELNKSIEDLKKTIEELRKK